MQRERKNMYTTYTITITTRYVFHIVVSAARARPQGILRLRKIVCANLNLSIPLPMVFRFEWQCKRL